MNNSTTSLAPIPQMVVQLINDDGPASPLLEPFIEQLKLLPWISELRVVIPSTDRSWIGSAMSRRGALAVTPRRIGNLQALLVDGNPADCANLGLFSLFSTPADLVISGPNLGQNAGGPFTMCSGTLGGAMVAFLGGAAAIAVSSEMTPEYWEKEFGKLPDSPLNVVPEQWRQIAITSANLVERSVRAKLHLMKAVLNINLPWGADINSEVVITKVQSGSLPRFFSLDSDGLYRHAFKFPGFDPDPTQHLDHDCIVKKKVSISLLKPMHATLELSKLEEQELLKRLSC